MQEKGVVTMNFHVKFESLTTRCSKEDVVDYFLSDSENVNKVKCFRQ